MASNAATSSVSTFGEITWISVEEVAQLLNTSVYEFTPETFNQVYEDAWIKEHESQAKIQTNTAEAELKIIDQVKDETDSADETTAPAESDTEDGSTDATDSIDNGSAGGRKLVSVAAKFMSAALRVFGV